jgi:hypothetical protein
LNFLSNTSSSSIGEQQPRVLKQVPYMFLYHCELYGQHACIV